MTRQACVHNVAVQQKNQRHRKKTRKFETTQTMICFRFQIFDRKLERVAVYSTVSRSGYEIFREYVT